MALHKPLLQPPKLHCCVDLCTGTNLSMALGTGGSSLGPTMHDYEFSGRMEREGRWFYSREPRFWARPRRFRKRELRTLFRWLAIQSLYRVGVSPYLLGRFYPDVRGDAELFIAQARERIGQNKAAPERLQAETPLRRRDHSSSGS